MKYKQLNDMLEKYNWDDGFKIPIDILKQPDCDLALALKIFYLGDGYQYLRYQSSSCNNIEWQK